MLPSLLLCLLGVASAIPMNPNDDNGKTAVSILRRSTSDVSGITKMCPDLNFEWHAMNTNTMPYYMDLLSVVNVDGNVYELTIHVKGKEQIPLKYLWSLKIIGINGPQGTKQLYGKNENTYIIDNPTDFTTTVQIYGQTYNGDDCKVAMPPFQIQYEYLQGDAAQYSQS